MAFEILSIYPQDFAKTACVEYYVYIIPHQSQTHPPSSPQCQFYSRSPLITSPWQSRMFP